MPGEIALAANALDRQARCAGELNAGISEWLLRHADDASRPKLLQRFAATPFRICVDRSQVRPELPLIVALADALGAELRVVPRTPQAQQAARERGGRRRVAATG